MKDFQIRVIEEKAQLTERLSKLVAFLGSDAACEANEDDVALLMKQAEIMQEYQRVLVMRVRRFRFGCATNPETNDGR